MLEDRKLIRQLHDFIEKIKAPKYAAFKTGVIKVVLVF